jgi:hypothetical protein
MNQQAPNRPRTTAITGRYRSLIGFLAVLGLLGGAVFAWLNPQAETTSRALVIFTTPSCPDGAICGGPAFEPAYDQSAWPATSVGVTITPVNGSVVSVGATGPNAAGAEAALGAAANGYVAYGSSLTYMGQRPSARIIDEATTATGSTSPKQLLYDGLLGALFAALVGILAALAGSQATIDSPPAPPGTDFDTVPDFGTGRDFGTTPGFGAGAGETGREEAYGLRGVPLAQLAREYAERSAAAENG